MDKQTTLTGITTTGTPHLGNYAGAIKQAIRSSKKDDHALISEFELNEYVMVHGTASNSITIDDVFSLSGFSDALNRAKVECGLFDLVS